MWAPAGAHDPDGAVDLLSWLSHQMELADKRQRICSPVHRTVYSHDQQYEGCDPNGLGNIIAYVRQGYA